MELLAQTSQILYDKQILDFSKRLHHAEEENKILHTPTIHYTDEQDWEHNVKIFKDKLNNFIFCKSPLIFESAFLLCNINLKNEFFMNFKKIYEDSLFTLLKYKHRKWCKYKAQFITETIQVGIAGLEGIILQGGRGTYPFTNWNIDDYKIFIWNIINYHSRKEAWLYKIPLFNPVIK